MFKELYSKNLVGPINVLLYSSIRKHNAEEGWELWLYRVNGSKEIEKFETEAEADERLDELKSTSSYVDIGDFSYNLLWVSSLEKDDIITESKQEYRVVFNRFSLGVESYRPYKAFDTEEERDAYYDEVADMGVGGGLVQKDSYSDLPERGNKNYVYIVKDTGQTYYWDSVTETYITTGTAGRTGYYSTTQDLPTTLGQQITINKSDLTVLVEPTVPYSEGCEVIGANAAHGLIVSNNGSTVTVKTIMDATIDSFKQVNTENDLPAVGQANVLYAIKDVNEFRAWDLENNQWYKLPLTSLNQDVTVKCEQGMYKVGDEIPEGTPLETIIVNMLLKTNYPKLTDPSATMTATGVKLLECGSELASTFTITFNQGSINPAYGTNGKRAGEATGYSINGGTTQVGTTFNIIVSESNAGPFTGKVNYAQGPQPLDDEGGNYDQPLPAGSINTNQIKYEFVNALWSNSENINTVARHGLVSKTSGTYEFNFVPQTATKPEIFDVPSDWTVSKVEMYNPLSGKYESVASEFTITNTTHNNAAGASVNYKRYTDNRGYAASDRKIRITFS